jgi:sulfoxide reductase heme-binding subunit YedZ
MHLTSNPIDWYTARAAGITAYVLLSGVVLVGLTMGAKKTFPSWPRFAVEDVHRFGGLLVGTFVSIHVVAIALDAWLPFSLGSLIVPLTSSYRPLWVGLGIAAAELLLAIAVTNHYRRRLRYTTWRRIHYLNLGVWWAATLHGLGSGTDRSSLWLLGLYGVAAASVSAGIVWRVTRRAHGVRGRAAAGLTAVIVPVVVVGAGLGPLRFRPNPWNAASFNEVLTGQVQQLNGVSRGIVSMVGQGHGRQPVLVRADLLFAPSKLLRTSFQMEYLPSGALCTGTVTRVQPTGFAASCHLKTGARRQILAQWQGGTAAGIAGGTIAARAA